MKILPLALFIIPFLAGCGANNTPPQTPIPGEKTSAKLRTLETGAAAIQSRPPVDAISTYLDGFHFYSGDKNGQMEAHHYVTVLNEDVMQAVIYDGNTKNARLMGVEYIISERLFKTLPPEEKKLWHSHQYEVKSGSLVAPGLPQVADKALMSKIVNTYGKTWHTWHTDRDKTLPMGIPALMMGFTGDGQLDPRCWPIGIAVWELIPRPLNASGRICLNIPLSRGLTPGSREKLSSYSVFRALANTGEAIPRTSVHLSNPDNNSTLLHADTKKNAC